MVMARKSNRKASLQTRRPADKFTRAEERRTQAHIRARDMTFKVFLPESLASWLRKRIEAGVFDDPAEAAFLAF